MIEEFDIVKLSQLSEKVYSEFSYVYKVLREANVDTKEAKNLVNKTLEVAGKAEEVFDKIEGAISGVKGDDIFMLRQSISEKRKYINEFKKVYGLTDSEPNA